MTGRRRGASSKPAKAAEPAVTAAALTALGARRLAAILLARAEWDEALAQSLRLAIASAAGTGGDQLLRTLSAEIDRIAQDGRFYGEGSCRDLAEDLDRLRDSIVWNVLPGQPRAAAELLARLTRLDGNIFERADDSGTIGDVFRQAVEDHGAAWAAVPDRDRAALAQEVFTAFTTDGYGVRDDIVPAFKDALGPDGLDELERLFREERERRRARSPGSRERALTRGLKHIAEAR